MVKRKRINEVVTEIDATRQEKRLCSIDIDRLSALSDELVLRILSFLPVSGLSLCQRLSSRLYRLAGDSQLWKAAYYRRFVRHRAARIPGIRAQAGFNPSLIFSSRISKWLGDDRLVKGGLETNWKSQYKLRHNWSRGSCDVQEIQVANQPSTPQMLVQLYSDVVVTADSAVGLRAWMTKGTQRLLALSSFDSHGSGELIPTSLAVDTSNYAWTTLIISVGFADGRFGIYAMDKMKSCLERIYMHAPLVNSRVSAIAVALPYIITITEAQLLSVYSFSIKPEGPLVPQNSDPPQLLSCLKSYTIWPPLSLSIRIVSTNIIASIVYALPIFLSGWSVGLQEFRFTLDGNVLDSRLTCAASQGFEPLISRPSIASSPMEDRATPSFRSVEFSETPSLTKPTSLSYSHPYLLASHPDNTLTLYLVHSTERELVIGNGSRLWGHTSSISGAHVGDRGKAVSVSEHGSEIRIWDLEGGISSSFPRNRLPARETGVQLIPDIKPTGVTLHTTDHLSAEPLGMGIGLNLRPSFGTGNSAITKGWVGFDDEKVIVLREKSGGSQALVIYDFS